MRHERGPRAKQFGQGLLVAIEQVVSRRLLCLVDHYDPAAVVVGLAFDAEIEAGELRLKQLKVRGNAGSDVDPLLAGYRSSHCIDLIRRGMQDEARAIRLRMLGDERFLAG